MAESIKLNPNSTPKPFAKPNKSPIFFFSECRNLRFPLFASFKPISCSQNPRLFRHYSLPRTLETLDCLRPFALSNRRSILLGWLCSVVSVASLTRIVPGLAKLAASVADLDAAASLRNEGLALGFWVAARIVGGYLQQAFLWDASLGAACEIRAWVFGQVMESDLGVFEGRKDVVFAGDFAYRITAEASDVANTMFALLNTTVPSILQLSAMVRHMLGISPVLSLILAMTIPCMAFVTTYLGEELRKISKNANYTVAALSAYLNEILPAILFVKINNGEHCENSRFQKLARADFSARLRKKKMKAVIPQIIKIMYFGSLSFFVVGSFAISRGSFDGRGIVSFITSLVFLIEPIQGIGKSYNELKQGEPAIKRLFNVARFKSKIAEKPDAIDLNHVKHEIRFRNVSFKYRDDLPLVLNGVDLHIKAGETVALVGPSGGGKSTIAKLLLRLYDPFSGYILLDNHNIQDIQLVSLRRHVGLVSQDVTLFSGTVAENIGYRDLMYGIDMERVENAARTANADEFITQLPNGYETEVGPRGSTLSGGQRQRIAIARALYQNSSMLILDEATSALDSKSEFLVRQAVKRVMENRTVLVIAHRLETVQMAERVYLLENGKLRELSSSALFDRSAFDWLSE